MTGRAVWLRRILLFAFGLLVLRLVHLQALQGASYRQLAERNRIRLVPHPAPRGLILDRTGKILATNHLSFRLAVVPQETRDPERLLTRVGELIQRSPDALRRTYLLNRSLPFVPAAIVTDVTKATALLLEEERLRLPGLLVEANVMRSYPMGTTASHLLGYLSQPTPEELPLLKEYGVRPQELIGRTGLERLFDPYLRGRSGGTMVEVDHRARQVQVLGQREPVAGKTVELTIDAQLQAVIEPLFGGQPGACVVLRPQTGEVLAMVSSPVFPPEVFLDPGSGELRRILDDPKAPLMNRATLGVYLPGSIVKLATAAAGLETRAVTETTPLVCPGFLTIGDRTFHCWNRDGHGTVTLPKALAVSCNVYFMQLGRRLGLDTLRTFFSAAGLTRSTGWPLEERQGLLPHGRRITEGEVAMLAMGQGELLITPLQAAIMGCAVANGGGVIEPWVVKAIEHQPVGRPARRQLGWSDQTFSAIRRGMHAAVRDPEGTAHTAFSDGVSIAGKTGTAQTHRPGEPHGWFVGFCPFEEPRAAFAIVAEHGGSGSGLPAAIGKAICEYLSEHDTG